jgi:hypothetical protein
MAEHRAEVGVKSPEQDESLIVQCINSEVALKL